ncbi:MAG: peptidylprolyl isomerase [Gemmatimonadota bacterium]|nr:peptidylprolyl isomerase [Gemmatimonadota bacterium]
MVSRTVARAVALLFTLACSTRVHAQGAASKKPTTDTAGSRSLTVNKVAGVVNNEPIMMSQVMSRVFAMQSPNGPPLDSIAVDTLTPVALKSLMADEVQLQKARADKVEIAEGDVRQKADEDFKEVRSHFQSDAEMLKVLKQSGFGSIDDFKKNREDQLRNEMTKRDLMAKSKREGKIPAVNVTEADVTKEFNLQKASFPKKMASVGFRQIILPLVPSEASRVRARAKADSLRAELVLHPDEFETMAKHESMDDASKELGGDLGWRRRGELVPEFERAIFSLNPGVISPVVETTYGFHIIRVDRVQPAEVKSRHILIKFVVDSNDAARSMRLADSVAKLWRAGANYDTLVAHFHDSANNELKTVPEFTRDSLPLSYQKAIRDQKLGDIIGPFPIADDVSKLSKPVILQLTKIEPAGDYTIDELRQRIRSSLIEQKSAQRFIDSLLAQAYVWVNPEIARKSSVKIVP